MELELCQIQTNVAKYINSPETEVYQKVKFCMVCLNQSRL